MKKKQTPWLKHLTSVYHEMKIKNPNVKLKDAMKIAKKSYKK